jgi:hypothetical protein
VRWTFDGLRRRLEGPAVLTAGLEVAEVLFFPSVLLVEPVDAFFTRSVDGLVGLAGLLLLRRKACFVLSLARFEGLSVTCRPRVVRVSSSPSSSFSVSTSVYKHNTLVQAS